MFAARLCWLAFMFCIALTGELYLARGQDIADGWLLFAVASTMFLALAWRVRPTEPPAPAPAKLGAAQWASGLLALGLAGSAAAILARPGHFNEGMILYSLAGLLVAATWWYGFDLLGAVKRLIADGRKLWPELLIVAGLFAIGVWFRVYRLADYPPQPGGASDEGNIGIYAFRLLKDASYRPVYAAINGSTNLFHPIAAVFALSGVSTLALRIPSVVWGILTLLPFYGLARELYSRPVALACLGLLVLSFWHNNMARFVYDWAPTLFFSVVSVYFIMRAERTGSRPAFVAAGIALGMGIYGYTAFRIFPALVALWLLYRIVFVRGFLRRHGASLVLAIVAFVLVTGPNLAAAARAGDIMGANFQHVVGQTLQQANQTGWNVIGERFVFSLSKIAARHVRDWPPIQTQARGLLDPLTAALFIVGLVYCIVFFRRRANFLLASTVIATILFGEALASNQYTYRTFNILPFVYLIAGSVLQTALFDNGASPARTKAVSPSGKSAPADERSPREESAPGLAPVGLRRAVAIGIMTVLVALSGVWNVVAFDQHSRNCEARSFFQDRPWDILSYVQTLGSRYHVYIISNFPWHFPLGNYTWLTDDIPVQEATYLYDVIPSRSHGQRDVAYIVTDPVDGMIGQYLQDLYPSGVLEDHPGPRCTQYRFIAFRVNNGEAEAVAASAHAPTQGLRARYYEGPGWSGKLLYERLEPAQRFRFDEGKRISAIWDGTLDIAAAGLYTFTLTTVRESLLLIDGQEVIRNQGRADNAVPASGARELSPGAHTIEVRYDRFWNSGTMELRWEPPGSAGSAIVPLSVLRPPTTP